MLFLGVKAPKTILYALQKRGLQEIPPTQLYNFLQRHKKKTQGAATMNVGEFEDWCSARSTPSIDDPNAAFVVCHETSVDEGVPSMRVFVTTPRLLENATRSSILHADATYKLNTERLPVIVVGTTDRDRHFHPIGLGLTSGETADDYAFVFRGIVDGVQRTRGVQYSPEVWFLSSFLLSKLL